MIGLNFRNITVFMSKAAVKYCHKLGDLKQQKFTLS